MMYLGKDPVAIAKETGAQYVKGTFTVPNSGSTYTLNFGKTFNRYLFLIEMTDSSKTSLLSSGENANKAFLLSGKYPPPEIGIYSLTNKPLYARINPTTKDTETGTHANFIKNIDGASITLNVNDISGSLYSIYRGYVYNYYIVEIK